jgi:hypothetical protein
MTIEEMEAKARLIGEHGNKGLSNPSVSELQATLCTMMGNMWSMTAEICKRLDAIEENGHAPDGKDYV